MELMSIMIKPVSGQCNLKCRYCFYRDEMNKRKKGFRGNMGLDTLEKVIRKTLEKTETECTISYQGGEPTLRGLDFFKSSLEIQNKYNQKNVMIHNAIQINGYDIDEKWAEFFSENHFLVGVSVDGNKRTNDMYRQTPEGTGSFEKIMHTINLFKQYDVNYNVLTVVNSSTAKYIKKIYSFYQKNRFEYVQFIPCLDPLGDSPGKQEFSLTPHAYGEFLKELFDLWYEDLKKGTHPYIRMFENIIGIYMGKLPEACDQRGICSRQYVIEADGSVYPCDFFVLDQYCLGNLNTDSYAEIDRKRQEIHFIEKSARFSQECMECRWFPLCRGGCRRMRMEEENKEERNYLCEAYRAFFEYTSERFEEIAARLRMKSQA